MDPFNMLPPEIQVQILIWLRFKRYILPLVQASPVMLEQYSISKAYITRVLLASDLDDDSLYFNADVYASDIGFKDDGALLRQL
ncbi:hypothetical protein G7Z17_g108 [Cylindrodendrum hubeiense]|uniref:Uncharacterized protein n=1 Tax=Cylindrodendrum hubeiense TaxID=595255 RepID=A0A9P5HHH0_9HYPO|nr:hypothetical protein G7Z17_g108 [Cylindrodendrum hubeiense]